VETSGKSCVELGILNEEELINLGKRFASCLENGDILILSGEIGSGKTTFVRGIVHGLGCNPIMVTSPTFTLMNVYSCHKTVYHIDAYRLNSIDEAFYILEAELEEDDGIFIIEWGETLNQFFNEETINIRFEHIDENHRKVSLCVSQEILQRLRRCL